MTKLSASKVVQNSLCILSLDIWLSILEHLDFISLIRVSRTLVHCVYNIVLELPSLCEPSSSSDRGVCMGGGTVCCTLGMSVTGYEDLFWGTDLVVQWLQNKPDYPYVITPSTFVP
ncbi:hypothetical protein Pelo_593 [Pelomyxa schiedti]|nr:hypothetical protein Pelo_593 [Pelomyxa schiedti]